MVTKLDINEKPKSNNGKNSQSRPVVLQNVGSNIGFFLKTLFAFFCIRQL
jgi:hypothetical protein